MHTQVKKKSAKKQVIKSKKRLTIKEYDSDPFFKKKDERADAFLEKHGFPKELLSKKK